MSLSSSSFLLEKTLRTVVRRYCLPAAAAQVDEANSAGALAVVIEQARQAMSGGGVPGAGLKADFTKALARMIGEAMHPESGDPGFQAMVLRHGAKQVDEYASLSSQAGQDGRLVRGMVNAMAHPAKLRRLPSGSRRDGLTRLQEALSSASWPVLFDIAGDLLAVPEVGSEPSLRQGLAELQGSAALGRLRRLDALGSDALVHRYRSLLGRHGPCSGSPAALEQGHVSRRRGAAVEALAMRAVAALAERLNQEEGAGAVYRVVTSMRVPASVPGSSYRAKSEWDVVLLRRAQAAATAGAWDVCLLVEAKASVDAAVGDLPRLMRGLRLLAHADASAVYAFETRQGVVRLRGASLNALSADEAGMARTVLYCCDVPAESAPRLLGAASRMRLLSAPASLEFAAGLTKQGVEDIQGLEQVWHQLLESPDWSSVLHQYPTLRQARELMVHAGDLMDAVRDAMPGDAMAAAIATGP
ncbi:MAG: 3-deoxy-D-arabino-heptulosonate 7-phosphate synthase [Burkholderiaceae bacterium]